MIKCAAISDVHNDWQSLADDLSKGGDLLIVAGDLTEEGTTEELEAALEFLEIQPFTHKLVIAGNHDTALARLDLGQLKETFLTSGILYLEDELLCLDVNGSPIRIYGSPWTPRYGQFVFQASEIELWEKYKSVPKNLDLLITHGPPYGTLDHNSYGHSCGSRSLTKLIEAAQPKFHVFGHIHEGRGTHHGPLTYSFNVACKVWDKEGFREENAGVTRFSFEGT